MHPLARPVVIHQLRMITCVHEPQTVAPQGLPRVLRWQSHVRSQSCSATVDMSPLSAGALYVPRQETSDSTNTAISNIANNKSLCARKPANVVARAAGIKVGIDTFGHARFYCRWGPKLNRRQASGGYSRKPGRPQPAVIAGLVNDIEAVTQHAPAIHAATTQRAPPFRRCQNTTSTSAKPKQPARSGTPPKFGARRTWYSHQSRRPGAMRLTYLVPEA
jgi:hypothetical protein